jgi:ABC-type branched-subunit amino acid transport system substrate-binding protein
MTKDDATPGNYIFASSFSGSLMCGGSDHQYIEPYEAYAYDAVYAVAHALHTMIETEGKTTIVGSELLDTLLNKVDFAGATGTVKFSGSGDRTLGVTFEVLNYQTGASPGLVSLGSWKSCSTGTISNSDCSWSSRYTAATSGPAAEYSTGATPPTQRGSASNPVVTVPTDVPPVRPSNGVSEIWLGAVFQMIMKKSDGTYEKSLKGVNRFAAFYMALNEINSDSTLLPNTQLKFVYHDTHADSYYGFFDAASLATGTQPISAVIGAAYSGVTAQMATVFTKAQIPQISYSATSPSLSNATVYPYFLRTPGRS